MIDLAAARRLAPLLLVLAWVAVLALPARAAPLLDDNAGSIAVVIGNRDYRQTVPVDYAHNDAGAMRDYLTGTLGFRAENVFVLEDATLSEMTQMFGSANRPQAGRLWRAVQPGASNVFVYYSGHGVPDLATNQPFLLPADGDPNVADSGYPVELLYRNLELVRDKVGEGRRVIVMIDACFTGETGRGESLLAVSAPGFVPAAPKPAEGVVRLVATSGAAPANWDDRAELGLFTSRFLMGAAGLADADGGVADDGAVAWDDLGEWVTEAVRVAALRDTGRPQVPEIDTASLTLPGGAPVSPVAEAVELARDEAAWERAQVDVASLERYAAECTACRFRDEALARLADRSREGEAAIDRERWAELSLAGDYQTYLDECGAVCAYRPVAEAYLRRDDPSRDPAVGRCDMLAAGPDDADRPEGVDGVPFSRMDGFGALDACEEAVAANPKLARAHYQRGRALDRLGRYGEAMEAYEAARELGSMAALNNIAVLHENGEGVPPSPETAFPLYVEAAEGGDIGGMNNAGRMLQYGRGTDKDVARAISFYRMAADRGDGFAIVKLVPFYLSGGPGIEADPEAGFRLFDRALDKDEPMALATVATLIDQGFGKHFPGLDSTDMVMRALAQGESGLASVVGTTAGTQPLSAETIKSVQEKLAEARFYDGELDGTFNPLFMRALDAYSSSASSQTASAQ